MNTWMEDGMHIVFEEGVLKSITFCCEDMAQKTCETKKIGFVFDLEISDVGVRFDGSDISFCPWCGKAIEIAF